MALDISFDEILEMNVEKLSYDILRVLLMFTILKTVRRVISDYEKQ